MSIRLRYWLDAMRELESVKAARSPVESHAETIHQSARHRPAARTGGKVEFLHA